MPRFTIESFQNEYLPPGGATVDAVITVTAAGGVGPSAEAAEVILLDVSGSMEGTKLDQARQATAAAIASLRDGVNFAVVAGNHVATMLYPTGPPMAQASDLTRGEAVAALNQLEAVGGTAIGRWIALATQLLETQPGVRHALLLTDGNDEHETPAQLKEARLNAVGVFRCDCRGVGDGWALNELKPIADSLLGTVEVVAQPEDLVADFEAIMAEAMQRQVGDMRLRVWVPNGAEVLFLKQAAPHLADLTPHVIDARTTDFPTGDWRKESRDYHLRTRVIPGEVGETILAARVKVIAAKEPAAQALVIGRWTNDSALAARIEPRVASYTGQAELAAAIGEGLEARRVGDVDTAAARLGRAVQLADQLGRAETARLLRGVVDVEDISAGLVALKPEVDTLIEITLDTRSTKTVRPLQQR